MNKTLGAVFSFIWNWKSVRVVLVLSLQIPHLLRLSLHQSEFCLFLSSEVYELEMRGCSYSVGSAWQDVMNIKSAESYQQLTTRYTFRSYICSPTRNTKCFNEWVLFSTYVSSTYFGPHRSIIRSVLYTLYSQTLVCGNTRTIRHVQPLQSCRTCRVVRVLPHTKVCKYSFYKTLLMVDRWGPKHVQLTKSAE